jgi:hypothetical protein
MRSKSNAHLNQISVRLILRKMSPKVCISAIYTGLSKNNRR